MKDIYQKAAKIVKESDALLVTAGAGIGVDSGLPDFRGNTGFWKEYPVIKDLGVSFVEMANPEWFVSDPKLAWAFYGHRMNLYRSTVPHKGFNQLLEVGKQKDYGYFVYTSNVDGQFQIAGFDDDKIVECHGSIHHLQCVSSCSSDIWSAKDTEVIVDKDTFTAGSPLPECPKCGSLARPNVLMFGDWGWFPERTDAQSKRMANWLGEIQRNNAKLAIIELGAGTAVPSVRMKSRNVAHYKNATLIRINPRDYKTNNGISIPTGAAEGIERIINF